MITGTNKAVPRRIALFTGNYNHIADGVSLTLNRLVGHLEKQGIDVIVFGPTVENPPVRHVGRFIPVPSIPAPGRAEYRISLGLPRSAREQIQSFRPSLFHIATPDLLGRSALLLARKSGIPVVASYHTYFSSYLKYYRVSFLEGIVWNYLRWFYNHCDQVYVPSASMAAVLQAHEVGKTIRIWQRGIDTTQFSPSARSATWRDTLGAEGDTPIVTFVSRLVWEKGLDVYASVIEELQEMGVPHHSLVVGDGPARSELADRLPNTTFTGHLAGEALSRAYASSDVFLFPSDTETFGNVTLEAMASGLPCVCADAPGSSSLVQHGITGFLAPAGSKTDFANYVLELVSRPALREAMREAARERAMQFEWDTILGRIVGYYDELLNTYESKLQFSPTGAP